VRDDYREPPGETCVRRYFQAAFVCIARGDWKAGLWLALMAFSASIGVDSSC
jgi:hypothetical protein